MAAAPILGPEPQGFIDPITNEVMLDPHIIQECGHTFDRESILEWFNRNRLNLTCPLCRQATLGQLVPNFALREALEHHALAAVAGVRAFLGHPRDVFGAEEWLRYFGVELVEPPLPPNFNEVLLGPCPFRAGRTIRETHILVLIPATVNGEPYTLDRLHALIQHPREGFASQFEHYHPDFEREWGARAMDIEHPYWVLMTREAVDDSKDYEEAYLRASELANASAALLALTDGQGTPTALEVATGIMLDYVRSGEMTIYRFNNQHSRFSRRCEYAFCQEVVGGKRILVGKLSLEGLRLGKEKWTANGSLCWVWRLNEIQPVMG